jgi:hypothetical protein
LPVHRRSRHRPPELARLDLDAAFFAALRDEIRVTILPSTQEPGAEFPKMLKQQAMRNIMAQAASFPKSFGLAIFTTLPSVMICGE